MESVYCSVYVTAPDLETARKLAGLAVEHQLAACATILPAAESVYRWDGKVVQEAETVLFLKTTTERFDALREALCNVHPYDVPCIVAIPIMKGHQPYLDWVRSGVSG